MYHFAWEDQKPVQGNISYIALQPGQYLDISLQPGQYLDIAWESGSYNPHFNL